MRIPELEFISRADILLGEPIVVGEGPLGLRRVVPITGGIFEGPKLSGVIRNGGADWQVVAPSGLIIVDTRYTLECDAGPIYVATTGVRKVDPEVLERMAAGARVDPDEYYFRLHVKLEAGNEGLLWVNDFVFIASAARLESSVTYDLFSVL